MKNYPVLSLLLGATCLLGSTPAHSATENDDVLPKAYPVSRYETIWTKSPFTLSSASTDSATGFAANLSLAGIVKIGDESFVVLIDKTTLQRSLVSALPNDQGIQIVRMETDSDLNKVKVVLKKKNETSTVGYDLKFLEETTQKALKTAADAEAEAQAKLQQAQQFGQGRGNFPGMGGQGGDGTERNRFGGGGGAGGRRGQGQDTTTRTGTTR